MAYQKVFFAVLALLIFGLVIFLPVSDLRTVKFTSEGEMKAEIVAVPATNEKEWRKGLQGVEELEEDRGMLFIFDQPDRRSFWMKNTSIPLDIIFLGPDREILNIEQADPEPGTREENLTRYRSDGEALYVVEVNQGFTDRNGISEGDKVSWRRFNVKELIGMALSNSNR